MLALLQSDKQVAPTNVCTQPLGIEPILETSHPPMSWLKATALWNILSMFCTARTSQLEISPLNAAASANMCSMLVTLETAHRFRLWLNAAAPSNKFSMRVALDTSQSEMSWLNTRGGRGWAWITDP